MSPIMHALRRRPLLTGLGACAVLLTAGLALSGAIPTPPRAACCTGPLAVGDAMVNTSSGADKDFFESQSGPPNAMFLLGNNQSMQNYNTPLPQSGPMGCSDPALTAAMNWFSLTSTDPKRNGAQAFDPDPDFAGSGLHFFDPAQYYISFSHKLPLQGESAPYSLSSTFRGTVGHDTATACTWAGGLDVTTCQSCLTNVGWYQGVQDVLGNRRWVLSGRVLNVRPPKFVAARKVLKDVISTVENLRMGVATFTYGPTTFYDPAELLQPVKPPCHKSFPVMSEEDLNRNELMKSINTVKFDNQERSIGEALFSLGAYYSSEKVNNRWSSWFANPIGAPRGYPGAPNGSYRTPLGVEFPWARGNNDFTSGAPLEAGGEQKSVCFSCQASSVIVLSDGTPEKDNSVPVSKMLELLVQQGARHPDGTPLTFNPTNFSGDPGGVNYCHLFGTTKAACDYDADPSGMATHNTNYMDDVAFFLANMDLRTDPGMDGVQSVRTYTIGYGDNSPMLRSVAMAGKGRFYRADDPGQLREAILSAIADLRETSTSFSTSNLSSVQAGGMQSSVYVPRFIPRRNQPYEGHLYRFYFYSEFSEGCDAAKAKTAAGDPLDLNQDDDCEDTFYLDKPDSFTLAPGNVPSLAQFSAANIVQENVAGDWVKVSTATRRTDGKLVGGTPAVPFWDLAETLGRRSASQPCAQLGSPGTAISPTGGRCIFTLKDRNSDGKYTDADNPPVPFDVSSQADLQPLLLAGGDSFCSDVFARLNRVWTGTAAEQADCTRAVIRFIRGQDVFDFDGDTNTTEDQPCADAQDRSCKLADIFHSSPILVDPPAEPFLCDLGLSSQCLRTLYADPVQEGAPPASEAVCKSDGTSAKPCFEATPMSPELEMATADYGAYGEYIAQHGRRDRFILVGSNGGMLHAVHAGKAIDGRQRQGLTDIYDMGTGQELWAFIPPDLLPKLGLLARGHEYFVDGTVMVRDVWVDGLPAAPANPAAPGSAQAPYAAADGVKQKAEYRTLAVITERGGGQRYHALDVTNPYAMFNNGSDGQGPYRWMYPQACDAEAATFGQSWMNFAPKPPPIGPVRLKNDTTRRGWDERWVVFVNGGYSADLTRGRGLYMLDAWRGEKLWSFGAKPAMGGGTPGSAYQQDVADKLMPVAAAPALVDVGSLPNLKADQDGFFDTMVVGDLGGQVWTFRLFAPGETSSYSAPVNNWFGARTFELSRSDAEPHRAYAKTPFFNIASNTLQPDTGWLRTYLGSGDRQHIRNQEGIACAPDNLLACIRMRCDVQAELTTTVNGITRTSLVEYDNGVRLKDYQLSSGSEANSCGSGKMNLTNLRIDCGDALGASNFKFPPAPDVPVGSQSECTLASGEWSCTTRKLSENVRSDLQLSDSDRSQVPRNTYVGFYNYGGTRAFTDEASAKALDALRWTDTSDPCTSGTGCGLVDVSLNPAQLVTRVDANGVAQQYIPTATLATLPKATPTGAGWFIRYNTLDEKTAAGSTILGGIVLWPTFSPPSSLPTNACGTLVGSDSSRTWQMDIITGWPDQAESFKVRDASGNLLGYQPFKQSEATSPPPEPASAIFVSKTGVIRYSVADTGSGKAPATETLRENADPASDISWVEVPRNVHLCRHVDKRACK
jgi:type IV pilus assembly protein PilY1